MLSWDLIPRTAISTITLMPGSNPLFGLNTLGGALSVQTKDGRNNPGTSLQTTLGSSARRALEFEHGGSNVDKALSWHISGNLFRERGWREDSPSDVRQLFGKLGWHGGGTALKLTLAHSDNSLNGNGLQEQGLLARNRASVYTKPDITNNRASLLNWRPAMPSATRCCFRAMPITAVSTAAASTAVSTRIRLTRRFTSPAWTSVLRQALLNDEPAEKCNSLINRTQTVQRNYGLSGQLTFTNNLERLCQQHTVAAGQSAPHAVWPLQPQQHRQPRQHPCRQ